MDRDSKARRKRFHAVWCSLLGCILHGCILAVAPVTAVHAEPLRSAAEAPPAWLAFAVRLKAACERALQVDDETGRRLQESLHKLQVATSRDEPPMRVAISLWIKRDGTVDRVSFPSLGDPQATSDLRALLSRANAGAPPADLLQPVRLSVSLAPRK